MKHLPMMDCLRGVAALFVCIFHFVLGHGNYLDSYNTLTQISNYGWLGVEIFFVISGFVIPYSMTKYGYNIDKFWFFLKKRICRIEPPYLISVFIAFGLLWLSSTLLHKDQNISGIQLLLHIGYLNPFFGFPWVEEFYWTLGVEFQFYLFMGIFYALIFKNKGIFFLSIIIICFFPIINDSFKTFLSYSPLFCFGFVAKEFIEKKISNFETILLVALVFSSCLFFFKIEQAVTGMLTFLIIIFFSEQSSKVLIFFGKISFSLYLTHDIFGGRLINFLNRSSLNLNPLLILGTAIIFSIGISYIFYKAVELPSIALSKRIKQK